MFVYIYISSGMDSYERSSKDQSEPFTICRQGKDKNLIFYLPNDRKKKEKNNIDGYSV